MPSRTKFVFLMHPYEFKRVKANTGRLTHLCLRDSELHVGFGFDEHEAVQALIDMWGPVPSLSLMRALKDQFDPGHLMAPGRFAGGI